MAAEADAEAVGEFVAAGELEAVGLAVDGAAVVLALPPAEPPLVVDAADACAAVGAGVVGTEVGGV